MIIYIWDLINNTHVEGSPFSNYTQTNSALGLNTRTIFRLLDTGKMYKGRYLICSTPIFHY
jgi:hypothetical protein